MDQEDLGGFGDKRRRRIGGLLLAAMRERPTMRLHALAKDRNEALAFGHFLGHDAVSSSGMLATAGLRTGERASGRHVLAIQDTTEFTFPGHTGRKRGFGTAGNGRGIGLFLPPTLAVEATHGGVIGLVGAQVIDRTGGKVGDRKRRPAEQKESQRWLAGAQEAGEVWRARRW